MNNNDLYKVILIFVSLLLYSVAEAQEESENLEQTQISLPPLFEYPSAPDEIEEWTERNNWLVENFWKDFDYEQKSVGQIQLDHAFKTWTLPMRFAQKEIVMKSVKNMLSSLSKNPTLLFQFTKSAEANLYSPNAEIWIDEVYVEFLTELVKNKKIKDIRKVRYQSQLDKLGKSLVSMNAPKFEFEDRNGKTILFSPEAKYTIIEFGHPDCADCQIAKVKLDTNFQLEQLAKDNKVLVYFIIPDKDNEHWQEQVADYPHFWTVGAAEDLDEIYDIRLSPTFYIIGPDRKIVAKNCPVEEVIDTVIQLAK